MIYLFGLFAKARGVKIRMIKNRFKYDLLKGLEDFTKSFTFWQMFYLMSINEIKKRYARSSIGQFWLTISLAINVGTLGVIWSFIFQVDMRVYLPYLSLGIVFWNYISNNLTEGSYLYITFTNSLKEFNIPKLSYVNSLILKNLIVLIHNLPILVPIYLYCNIKITFFLLFQAILGLIITTVFLFSITIIISMFSLRFRDLPNIIASVLQIIFHATPIMWKIQLIPISIQKYFILNPFTVFLFLFRDPLLNINVSKEYWMLGIIYSSLSFIIAFFFFSKFRAKLNYWL